MLLWAAGGVVQVVDQRVAEVEDTGRKSVAADVLHPRLDRFHDDALVVATREPHRVCVIRERCADAGGGAEVADLVEEPVARALPQSDFAPAVDDGHGFDQVAGPAAQPEQALGRVAFPVDHVERSDEDRGDLLIDVDVLERWLVDYLRSADSVEELACGRCSLAVGILSLERANDQRHFDRVEDFAHVLDLEPESHGCEGTRG